MNAADLLSTAAEIVTGQRALDYGDKTQNHERIAALWNMWLYESKSRSNEAITAYDVSVMMMMVKVARLMHSPGHTDSHIDIAGYAACMEEISSAMAGEVS